MLSACCFSRLPANAILGCYSNHVQFSFKFHKSEDSGHTLQAPEKLLPWVLGLQREVMEIEMALQQHGVIIETLEGRGSGQQQSVIHKVPGKDDWNFIIW